MPAIVVTYLGRIGAMTAVISGLLVWRVVETSSGSSQAADAAVIGLVMAFIGITGACLTALGAILASTRGSSTSEAPTPVVVQNAASDPVPTTEAPPAVTMPDPSGADPGLLEPDPAP